MCTANEIIIPKLLMSNTCFLQNSITNISKLIVEVL